MGSSVIDESAFMQLLEMDDEPDRSFTRSLLDDFFSQVDESLPKFHELINEKRYTDCGKLGHFLKGSSAGVGAKNIRDICEEIQYYAKKGDDPESFLKEHLRELEQAVPIARKALYDRLEQEL